MTRDVIKKICDECKIGTIDMCVNELEKNKAVNKLYDIIIEKSKTDPIDVTSNIPENCFPSKIYKSIDPEHINSWTKGEIRMYNLSFYRNYDKSKGIGDDSEGTNNIGDVLVYNTTTRECVGIVSKLIQGPNINNVYILSFSCNENIKIGSEADRKIIEFSNFSIFLNKLIKNFKKIENVQKVFVGKVEYEDFSKNRGSFISCPYYRSEHYVFRKDIKYETQNEFRVAFFTENSYVNDFNQHDNFECYKELNLGDLSDCIKVSN